ncbi:MAG: hypothetical protein ACJA1Y_000029, partial [Burkholderiaceae bacterium]
AFTIVDLERSPALSSVVQRVCGVDGVDGVEGAR